MINRNLSFISLLAAIAFASSAFAADESAKGKTIIATANGMVCSFCAQGIDAQFRKEPAVKQVRVNLTRRWVVIEEVNNSSISDETVRKHISNAGFEVVDVVRSDRTFEQVLGDLEQQP